MKIENFSISELNSYFKSVFDLPVPIEETIDSTFLEISGFPHYEEVISNWYAFFFRSKEIHNLKTLFITSLIECYEQIKGKNSVFFAIEDTKVIRERTVNEKRIDLLLYDHSSVFGDTESYTNAIIIENKINATLYNELDIYHNGIIAEHKYGIVLSLTTVKINTPNFINVTHQELMERVLSNLGKYLVRANPKYLLLLKEFIQQIQTFIKTVNMKDTVDFYFENAQKINELIKVKERALDSTVENIKLNLEATDFALGRKYPDSINIRYKKDPQILMGIETNLIFTEGKYSISLWLSEEFAKNWRHKKDIPLSFTMKAADIILNQSPTGSQYALIATEKVMFGLSKENIEELPRSICNHLKIHWAPFLNEIIEILNR